MPLSRISGHGQTNNNVDNAVIMISHSHSGTPSRFRFERLSEVSLHLYSYQRAASSIHNVIALLTLHSRYGGRSERTEAAGVFVVANNGPP